MNFFGTTGKVLARDRKGKSLLLTIRFGQATEIVKDKAVQFVPYTNIRVPQVLWEKLDSNDPGLLQPGKVITVQGYFQGLLRQDAVTGTSLSNELVATNITDTELELEQDEPTRIASSKGFGKFVAAAAEMAEEGEESVQQPTVEETSSSENA